MGKANKVKGELLDATDMVDLIQTLKDIADNKYYTLVQQKDKFRRFGETFVEFFRMISMTSAQHKLISNDHPLHGILVITIDGSFLGEFNNRIIRRATELKEKYDKFKFIVVGNKSVDRFRAISPELQTFDPVTDTGMYELAVKVKDYLVDEIMNDRMGKVQVVYSWPKSFETQKPRTTKLLPCDDLVTKQTQFVEVFEKVIEESDPMEIIGYLSNLWITTRLYSIMMDTFIASLSAQANFLDDSLDKMKKEHKKMVVKYRKAKKSDIDKSLRETFSARMMTEK